jgi:hypothetical protein
MTQSNATPKKLIPIWFWVGLVLSIYGLIVGGTGVYYFVSPETQTALASLNPCFYWGVLMVIVGVIFLGIGWRAAKDDD